MKKIIYPYNHMSAVVEILFFRSQNLRLLNSKLGWVSDVNQTTN